MKDYQVAIERLIKDSGSIKNAAKAIGISRAMIYYWLNDMFVPSDESRIKLSLITGIPINKYTRKRKIKRTKNNILLQEYNLKDIRTLANKIKVNDETIRKWLKGDTKPNKRNTKRLKEICKLTNKDIKELFCKGGEHDIKETNNKQEI